ncbi:MAG: epoxyqueuosine reductase QueH [Clostridia bacterium]|nr:epoxyqueuosine reductase QueH [Clostridia bacterium]
MKLLLHICCAPCAVMCVKTLREEGLEPVGYWENPNIHPYTEYQLRKHTLEGYAREIGMKLIIGARYGLRQFLDAVGGDYTGRCLQCYRLRFRGAAKYAAENGYSHFTSTLFISPYQNHELMLRAAREAAEEFGVSFLHRDFRPYFQEGQAEARAMGMYMQKYCGCIFSEEDRYMKRKKKQEAEA